MRVRLLLLLFSISTSALFAQELHDKILFENSRMDGSYYHSETSYSQNSWVKNIQGKLPVSVQEAFTPGNSLELFYQSSEGGKWTAKIRYEQIRGIDSFKKADHLSFWIMTRSDTDPAILPLISLIAGKESDSKKIPLSSFIRNIEKGKWVRVLIPITDFGKAVNAENVNGIQFDQAAAATQECKLFLDQIELSSTNQLTLTEKPILTSVKGYEKHFQITWKKVKEPSVKYVKIYRSQDGGASYRAVGIQSPYLSGYNDFPGSQGKFSYKISFIDGKYVESDLTESQTAQTREMSGEDFLDMIQESNFRYYWEGSEPASGLSLENIPGRSTMIATGASGFGIMAIVAGVKRGFISREEAADRFVTITDFLLKADRFHGVFPHFLDGTTGKTVPFFGQRDNGGDLVETSFLMQGLLTARQFFDGKDEKEAKIRSSINTLWNEVEWAWYKRTPDAKFLLWHWSPDQAWVINHKLIGWNETLITYFLAIASTTHGVSPSMYYSGWASQSEEASKYRSAWGQTKDGSMYTNGKTYYGIKLPVGVSNGGPLFFTHYSFLGLDPHGLTDKYVNYFDNNKRITEINLRYCIENPKKYKGYGADFWGLTASDGPEHYSANEPMVHADEGKLTATGALASFPYTPEASMAALKNYYRNYGQFFYGYYGFKDALSLDKNWCSPIYMGLNQAPIVVMIENYRTKSLWDLFMSAPEVKQGIEKLNAVKN